MNENSIHRRQSIPVVVLILSALLGVVLVSRIGPAQADATSAGGWRS